MPRNRPPPSVTPWYFAQAQRQGRPFKGKAGGVLLPLLVMVVGALFFVLATLTYGPGALFGNRIYPIWALCVGLGVIAVVGGSLAMVILPAPRRVRRAQIDSRRYTIVPRTEYDTAMAQLALMEARRSPRAQHAQFRESVGSLPRPGQMMPHPPPDITLWCDYSSLRTHPCESCDS